MSGIGLIRLHSKINFKTDLEFLQIRFLGFAEIETHLFENSRIPVENPYIENYVEIRMENHMLIYVPR